MFPGDLPEDPTSLLKPSLPAASPDARAFPALPAAARQPRERRPATRRRCRTSASTAPSTSCSETAWHERHPDRAARSVFAPDDPALVERAGAGGRSAADGAAGAAAAADAPLARPTLADLGAARPALGHAAGLGARRRGAARASAPGSRASSRRRWCARTGSAGPRSALLLLAALAALMLLLRELDRLLAPRPPASPEGRRRRRHRATATSAASARPRCRLADLYAGRPTLAWSVRRFREHARDVHDPGELLALADRDIVAPLDARGARASSPARPSASPPSRPCRPMVLIAVGYVADREPAPAARRSPRSTAAGPASSARCAWRDWCSPTSSPPAASP